MISAAISSLRETLEKEYQINTSQAYAVTEPGGAIAYECQQKQGMHLMDEYIVEIVDPETGKQLNAGEVGEIVVTPIHNKAWGLIRFGTGDMSSYTTETCPCGRTTNRLAAIVGRTSDAIKVRGMFIVAKQAEEVISSFTSISAFQILVRRIGQRDEITLRIELKDKTIDEQKLAAKFVAAGTIPEKRQTIIDERTWE